jgi:hypothetical protein
MDKIIHHGEPENMKAIHDATNELSVLNERGSRLKEKQSKVDELKDQQSE